jgi:hypothetical protein
MTLLTELREEFLTRSRQADDQRAAALFASASAQCAVGEALAGELRLLTVGDGKGPGAIEDFTRHIGERIDAFTEALRDLASVVQLR